MSHLATKVFREVSCIVNEKTFVPFLKKILRTLFIVGRERPKPNPIVNSYALMSLSI